MDVPQLDPAQFESMKAALATFVDSLGKATDETVAHMLSSASDHELWTVMVFCSGPKVPPHVTPHIWAVLQSGIGAEAAKRGWQPKAAASEEELAKLTPQEFVLSTIQRMPMLPNEDLEEILTYCRRPGLPGVPESTWRMLVASARQVGQARGLDVNALAGPDKFNTQDLIRAGRASSLKS